MARNERSAAPSEKGGEEIDEGCGDGDDDVALHVGVEPDIGIVPDAVGGLDDNPEKNRNEVK